MIVFVTIQELHCAILFLLILFRIDTSTILYIILVSLLVENRLDYSWANRNMLAHAVRVANVTVAGFKIVRLACVFGVWE